ncbi:glycosyltransferase family 4 protein [Anaeromyxobacter sp. SG17]|uniref:glycosyltransferase family 4 protein n=1 Tax=Anaeromyxobacter sp. SG17 TaxID=2925405 RepID=UPI001F59800C|nr:MraY family glycosyltransferase [Anaeromyxobacter sp. SG17]
MRSAGLAFVCAVLTGAVLTPIVRAVALRRGALDDGLSARKIHGKPVPRLGGIAIVLACVLALAIIAALREEARRGLEPGWQALALPAGGFAIAALGIFDDLRGATARSKFAVQFVVGAGVYGVGLGIDAVATPFGAPIQLGLLGLPLTVLWISGVINALNLVDGLDGLAGGVAFIALAVTFAIAADHGDAPTMLLTAAVAGAVLGFLVFNFHPASIFMGDTGSLFLGFVLATAALRVNRASSSAVALLVPLVLLGVPIADTLLAIVRRAVRGAPLFSADRGHIHHRLLDRGLTQGRAVLAIYGASGLLGAAALVLARATPARSALMLGALVIAAFVALRWLGYLDVRLGDLPRLLDERRRNVGRRALLRGVASGLHRARSVRDLWSAVCAAARALGAATVELRLCGGAAFRPLAFGDLAAPGLFRARFGATCGRNGRATLELGWDDGRSSLGPEETLLLEQLAAQLARALSRLLGTPAASPPLEAPGVREADAPGRRVFAPVR